jgi:hypothetical protein
MLWLLVILFGIFILMGLIKKMNVYEGNENMQTDETQVAQVAQVTQTTKKSRSG